VALPANHKQHCQVPEMAPEPLAPSKRKLLPSETSATELPTIAATASLEPLFSPSVNARVPFASCEHVSALAYAVFDLKINIAPGQLEASGITYVTGAEPFPKVNDPACFAEIVAAVVRSMIGYCKPVIFTTP